jgi:hypothetical protein
VNSGRLNPYTYEDERKIRTIDFKQSERAFYENINKGSNRKKNLAKKREKK